MKVCIFIPKFNGGGAEKAAICQANALSNANYDVTLLVLDPRDPMIPINSNVKINPICKRMRYLIFALPYYFFMKKPDIIISHLSVGNFICSLVSLFFKNVYSITTVQNDLTYRLQRKDYRAFIELMIVVVTNKICNQVIAVSEGVKKFLIEIAYSREKKVEVAYNPISISQAKLSPNKSKNKSNNIITDRYIVAVGRLVTQKGFDILLRSYSKTKLPYKNINLMIIGEGPLRKQLTALSKDLNIEKYVKFTGYLEDLSSLYSNAEFFVLSSRWEGFGNVVVEALAAGTRVVAFDCPSGPKEIIEGLEDCILVPFTAQPEDNLARALDSMTTKQLKNKSKLIKRANQFSIHNAGKSLITILKKIENGIHK